jgi:uncharacterized membrane protein YqaE (UPF0057 family)
LEVFLAAASPDMLAPITTTVFPFGIICALFSPQLAYTVGVKLISGNAFIVFLINFLLCICTLIFEIVY